MAEDAIHVIRLHGPYQCGIQNAECRIENQKSAVKNGGKPARVKVPMNLRDWLPDDFQGTVTLGRAFGLPTNLGERQRIHLVIHTEKLALAQVAINDISMANLSGQPDILRFDARPYLQDRNRLELTVFVSDAPIGVLQAVRLEILD